MSAPRGNSGQRAGAAGDRSKRKRRRVGGVLPAALPPRGADAPASPPSPSLSALLAGGPAGLEPPCSPAVDSGQRPLSVPAVQRCSAKGQPQPASARELSTPRRPPLLTSFSCPDRAKGGEVLVAGNRTCNPPSASIPLPTSPSLSAMLRGDTVHAAVGGVEQDGSRLPSGQPEQDKDGASSASPGRTGRRQRSKARTRVTFAGGPLGSVYGTQDGHPPAEGRVATSKRDLGGCPLEGFSAANIRTLAKLLGAECQPSIERLKRRLKAMEAGGSPEKGSKRGPAGKGLGAKATEVSASKGGGAKRTKR